MTVTHRLLAIAFAIVGHASSASTVQAQPVADREITVLSGDLYKVRDGVHNTVFLVTRESIVLVDPLSEATAEWLQGELAARFPDRPVRYLLLTHHHPDRAAGVRILAPGARVITHDSYRDALADSRRRNAAAYRGVPMPSSTFTDRRTIEVGGARIEMVAAGEFHSPDMALIVFPAQRTVFASDPPPFRTAPFEFGSLRPSQVVAWFETVARLDFDTIVFSDGTTSTRGDIAPLAEYLSRMHGAITIEYERGRSLKRLQDTLLLDAYKTLPHYSARRNQIESIFRGLRYRRVDFTMAGVANYFTENPAGYCATYDLCMAGGVVPAGTLGATFLVGRRLGFHAELTMSEQFWSTRARPLYDEEVVMRPTRGAVFIRYSPLRNWFSYALLAGVSRTDSDVRGMNRVHGGLRPAGGRHDVSERAVRYGVTAGVEFSQRIGGIRIVFPIRVTQTNDTLPSYWLDRFDVQAGAGISIPFFRSVK